MSNQDVIRYQQLANFVNLFGKSEFINMHPILMEMAKLLELNPDVIKGNADNGT